MQCGEINAEMRSWKLWVFFKALIGSMLELHVFLCMEINSLQVTGILPNCFGHICTANFLDVRAELVGRNIPVLPNTLSKLVNKSF